MREEPAPGQNPGAGIKGSETANAIHDAFADSDHAVDVLELVSLIIHITVASIDAALVLPQLRRGDNAITVKVGVVATIEGSATRHRDNGSEDGNAFGQFHTIVLSGSVFV